MTPKEKAKKLVDKFWKNGDKGLHQSNTYINFKCAKQCALICVDEKINSLNKFADYWNLKNGEWYKDELNELKEVKQEIEKL